ncbi:winged helix-turn-helix transcriptional regulator [Microvirga thermotolerans]|uniref:Winged helix-turn-helix transcriptional regulator n=1 Tax=Microvirga thermotolerans TaxID=2651334 RepID=A0A5P9JW21_9HYPH|nr:Lrp/AsnC family transcriptional regulator [Microvirga thermotolerans]QFU16301.1 winged helix-turn-helix transcriptional regulator [Microvirga thermotolerans]
MPYINLDALDLKILAALQEDGRLTNNELADRVGLSPSPCLRRVRRLERDGFIRAYRAVLNRDSVGLGLTVFVEIKVEKHSRDNAKALQDALSSLPEVVACHMVSGTADFMVEIAVPNLKAYERLLTETLLTLPMIGDIRSNFVLTRVKSEAPLPLGHLKRGPRSGEVVPAADCD